MALPSPFWPHKGCLTAPDPLPLPCCACGHYLRPAERFEAIAGAFRSSACWCRDGEACQIRQDGAKVITYTVFSAFDPRDVVVRTRDVRQAFRQADWAARSGILVRIEAFREDEGTRNLLRYVRPPFSPSPPSAAP